MKLFKLLLVLSILFFCLNELPAQTTHAHATSRLWKGLDVHAYLDQAASESNTTGTPIYLYNVGTGRFAIDGGDWGMEARLFYEDFGRQMKLIVYDNSTHTGKIHSGITETNIASDKHMFICNIPGVTQGSTWKTSQRLIFTTIMDGKSDGSEWHFVPIDNEDTTKHHTYYLYQQRSKKYQGATNKQYYLGAAYGEWCSDGTTTYEDGTANEKGCGYYVHVDDDRSCWTTAGQPGDGSGETLPYENTTKVLVNGDSVPIYELYQWRLITQEEFERVLNEEVKGINPSVSSLIPDRDFTRNSDDFYDKWVVTPANSTSSDEGRYRYTWGYYQKQTLQSSNRYADEPWDSPVKLKIGFDNMKNAKFGYMSFEGAGTVSVTFKIPCAGWYQVEAEAINMGPSNHPAYMYAQLGNTEITDEQKASDMRAYYGYGEVELANIASESELAAAYPDVSFGTALNKGNQTFNLGVGKVLTYHNTDHRRKFWVNISPSAFATDSTFTIGFRKDSVTKSTKVYKSNDKSYYYDTDWLVVDDIKMSFMGASPAFLYENNTNLDYLVFDADSAEVRPSASPTFRYSGALGLSRGLKKNQWNTLSLPIPVTGEQVRMAFGEDAKLVELVSVGTMSQNSNVIDFRTVELKPIDPETPAVVPGKFYMLWPTIDPVVGEDPLGKTIAFYDLGRNFFSVNPNEDASYSHYLMDPTVLHEDYAVESYQNANDGHAYVSYVRTPEYDIFAIDGEGYNTVNATEGLFVPKGAYAVSGGTIYELNRDNRIKGFRGWITLSHSIFDEEGAQASIRMAIDGGSNNADITGIEEQIAIPVQIPDDTNVYDLFGRRVGTIGTKLPKGIYIMCGKKFYVK